ncbi:YfiT family bacillithiol transferase [Muriicola sp. Z0-33]|uniref:YfiT family bacillithiol transferase n=1 Tax=Muriicola sp. Z0-33 TaxID=2816957 RepID=UPI002238C613|nr:putative metal-dependent hydrolase [Muriicola sp. Z0-33]MCW5517561.1 putative metal-dependent hydrolase [Muriicola sp. Z0-33]
MDIDNIEALRYPIGHFEIPEEITNSQLQEWIVQLEELPGRLTALVKDLKEDQLDTPYRPGGWTVRQTIHHISDSHHNSYTRFKWALTEDTPMIKAYDEKGWAGLFDTRTAPIALSLAHLSAVHAKLVYLLRGLSKEELQRSFLHPEGNTESTLEENIGRYVWHGNHHYTHIQNLLDREGWG